MPSHPTPVDGRTLASSAGVLYLVIIVCGLLAELVVRSSLVVPHDPGATADNILASPWLFRLGFASDAVMVLADVALAALLYLLFERVDRTLALVAAATRLAQAAVLALNLVHYYLALIVLEGPTASGAFEPAQTQALASTFLSAHAHGYDAALLFFGLHCVVLGRLLARASFAPRVLGTLMVATGAVYLLGSFTRFLWPDLLAYVSPLYAVAVVSEVWLCVWLLAQGRRSPAMTADVTSRPVGDG